VIVAKPSRGTVEETVERLEGEIARRGLKLFHPPRGLPYTPP